MPLWRKAQTYLKYLEVLWCYCLKWQAMVIDQRKLWHISESFHRLIPKGCALGKVLWGSLHQCATQPRSPAGTSMHHCRLPTSPFNAWEVRQDNDSDRSYQQGRPHRFDRWNKQLIRRLREAPQELRVPCGHHRRLDLSGVQVSHLTQPQQRLRWLLAAASGCVPSPETEGPPLFVTNNSCRPRQSDFTGRNKRRKPYRPAVWSQGQARTELPWLLWGYSQGG